MTREGILFPPVWIKKLHDDQYGKAIEEHVVGWCKTIF